LPVYQRLALKSFIDCGFEYTLYSYRKCEVPRGVELRDANEIVREERVSFYGARADGGQGGISGFSNLFRYHLLRKVGGWWVDADVICLSEKVPETDIFIGWEDEDLVGNAILKLPSGHRLARELCDAADRAGTNIAWGETGPYLLTRLVKEHGLLEVVSAQATGFPVRWRDALDLLIPQQREQVREQVKSSTSLHIWNEILRRAVVFTWMAPPPESFIAELFSRHGVSFGDAPVYTADQIQRLSDNYWNVRSVDELQRSRAAISELKSSKSWRVTAGARYVSNLLRGFR
jgi:hypothetical protein